MPEQPIIQPTQFDPEDEYRPEPEPEPLPPSWMDGSLRIGIHTSIAGSYLNALEAARKLGCNALQIFSASPRCGRAARRGFQKWTRRRFASAGTSWASGRWSSTPII